MTIRFTVELTAHEAADLALYMKRVTFEDFLSLTDSGQTRQERIEQAYRFRDAAFILEKALAEARGFYAR